MVRPLVEKYNITCLIAQPLPKFRGVVVTDRYLPRRENPLSAPIGHVYPITAPAMGRELLVHEELYDTPLHPADFSLRTAKEMEEFLRGVEEARDRGYGKSESESNDGVNAVASAVRGVDGRVAILLCLFGYTQHFPTEDMDMVGTELRAVADRIGSQVQTMASLA